MEMEQSEKVELILWFLGGFLLLLCVGYRAMRSRPADHREIEGLMKARGLRVISVVQTNNYLGYRDRLGLRSPGSTSRIYVATGEEVPGLLHEIHVWFDDWRWYGGGPRILLERQKVPDASRDRQGSRA